jgi:hypothetical protein
MHGGLGDRHVFVCHERGLGVRHVFVSYALQLFQDLYSAVLYALITLTAYSPLII